MYAHIKSWDDFVLLQVQSCRCETWVNNGLIDYWGCCTYDESDGCNWHQQCHEGCRRSFSTYDRSRSSIEDLATSDLKCFEQMRREEVEAQQKSQLEKEASFGKQFIPV